MDCLLLITSSQECVPHTVYQQSQRWLNAGVYKAMVHALRELLRLAQGRTKPPVVKWPEAKKGCIRLPRGWVGERSVAWVGRLRRLARDYTHLIETLTGWHFVAFTILILKHFV